MRSTIPLFCIALAFLSVTVSPQARAVCQEGCDTSNNTFLGEDALINNTETDNTAIGFAALFSNTTGKYNTANGEFALYRNTTGNKNTANGTYALFENTNGRENTATGDSALANNTIGVQNTGNGVVALVNNTTGRYNTAAGWHALQSNTTGDNNIGLGWRAGVNLTTGSNNIDIGNAGVAGESRGIRIGTQGTQTATFIAGISGAAVNGTQVVVNTSGRLGITASSARFKQEIKPMDKASEAILELQPVTFRYKKDLDPDGIAQFGLVAEEVEKVDPALVAHDEQGKPYTVRYEAVNAMLLNEFLKEHRKNEEQQAIIERQQKQIEALTAGLQKVSAELEASKSGSQTVLNYR